MQCPRTAWTRLRHSSTRHSAHQGTKPKPFTAFHQKLEDSQAKSNIDKKKFNILLRKHFQSLAKFVIIIMIGFFLLFFSFFSLLLFLLLFPSFSSLFLTLFPPLLKSFPICLNHSPPPPPGPGLGGDMELFTTLLWLFNFDYLFRETELWTFANLNLAIVYLRYLLFLPACTQNT